MPPRRPGRGGNPRRRRRIHDGSFVRRRGGWHCEPRPPGMPSSLRPPRPCCGVFAPLPLARRIRDAGGAPFSSRLFAAVELAAKRPPRAEKRRSNFYRPGWPQSVAYRSSGRAIPLVVRSAGWGAAWPRPSLFPTPPFSCSPGNHSRSYCARSLAARHRTPSICRLKCARVARLALPLASSPSCASRGD